MANGLVMASIAATATATWGCVELPGPGPGPGRGPSWPGRSINKWENNGNLGYLVLLCAWESESGSVINLFTHCPSSSPSPLPMRTLTPQLTFDIVAHTPRMPHCFIYCPATAAFSCFIVGSFISSQSCKNSSLLPLPPLPSPPLRLGVDCRRGWSSQTSVSDAKWAVNNVNNYCHYQLGDKVYS